MLPINSQHRKKPGESVVDVFFSIGFLAIAIAAGLEAAKEYHHWAAFFFPFVAILAICWLPIWVSLFLFVRERYAARHK